MTRSWLTLPAALVLAAALSGCTADTGKILGALQAIQAAQKGGGTQAAVPAAKEPAKPGTPAKPKPQPAEGEATEPAEDGEVSGENALKPKPKPGKEPRPGTVPADDDEENEEEASDEDGEGEDEGEETETDEEDGDEEEDGGEDEEDDEDEDTDPVACGDDFADVDTNRDREIQLREYQAAEGDDEADDPDHEAEVLEAAFNALDADGDGVLTEDEYCADDD